MEEVLERREERSVLTDAALELEAIAMLELNRRFSVESNSFRDLTATQLTAEVLDFLVEEFHSHQNSVYRELITVALARAKVSFDVRPLLIAFEQPEPRVGGARDCLLDILPKLRPRPSIRDWLVHAATRTDEGRASFLIFFAVAKFVEKEAAERILRQRFEDSPGTAAETLAKVGNAETILFLRERLHELELTKRNRDWDKGWHVSRVKRAIRSIEHRLAHKLISEKPSQ